MERTEGVSLFYEKTPEELEEADIVIIPGSKNTISDLLYLRNKGFSKAIVEHHKAGKPLYGICGGYQMMGEMVYDPQHIEGEVDSMAGLGILPVSTTIESGKTTRQCRFNRVAGASHGRCDDSHGAGARSANPIGVCVRSGCMRYWS